MVEPTVFRVFISGLILFTAQELYQGSGKDIGAAIAIAVSDHDGAYDVEIPDHEAFLLIDKDEFALDPTDKKKLLIRGTDVDRIQKIGLDKTDTSQRTIRLNADRVRFGEYEPTNSPKCKPFESNKAAGTSSGFKKNVPPFSSLGIKKELQLLPEAKPSGAQFDQFGTIDRTLLSVWLELSDGRLKVPRKKKDGEKQKLYAAEFRPSRHEQRIAESVLWRRKTDEGRLGCIIIDPFVDNDATPDKPDLVLFFTSGKVNIEYQNFADPDHGPHRDLALYDFEMYYRVLKNKPPIPPVPYYGLAAHDANAIENPKGEMGTTSVITGVNCGPARVP